MIGSNGVMDVLLPEEWYSHALQSALFGAGLRVPVYADALSDELKTRGFLGPDEKVPANELGICFIPGIPNEFMYHMMRTYGTPITEMAIRQRTVVVITPPLACFDNNHILGAKVVTDHNSGEPLMVLHKDAPPASLEYDVQHAFCHLHAAMAKMFPGNPFDFIGARLNPLTSGLQNIVCHLRLAYDIKETEQRYIDTSEVVMNLTDAYTPNVRTRIIPMPSMDAFLDNAYNIRVVVGQGDLPYVTRYDSFTSLFDGAQDFINRAFEGALSFRHVKVNKNAGELVICVHDPTFKYETCTLEDQIIGAQGDLATSLGVGDIPKVEVERVVSF